MNKKKFIAAALALCLVLGVLPMSVLAAQYTATLADKTEVTIDVDDTTGEASLTGYYSVAPTTPLTPGSFPKNQGFTLMQYYDSAPETVTGTLVEESAVLTFTVSFAPGEHGTGEKAAVSQSTAAGETSVEYTLPDGTGFTAEDGYVFTGWTVGSDTAVKAAGETITLTADVTLTAQWEAEGETVVTVTPSVDPSGNATVDAAAADAVTAETETLVLDLEKTATNGATVTIKSDLVTKVAENDVQTVQVVTGIGSADVPVDKLPATGDATVSVKPAVIAESALPEGTDAAVKAAVAAAKAVTITVTDKDGKNLFETKDSYTSADLAVTITLSGLKAGTTYVVLCLDDNFKLTSFGRFANIAGSSIQVKSRHLSAYIPVEETAENAAALAAVAADAGNPSTPAVPVETVNVKFTAYTPADTAYAEWGSGKLELTGLKANEYYTVQLGSANTTYKLYQVVQADTNGKVELRVQSGLQMDLFHLGASAANFTAGMGNGNILNGGKAIALSSCTAGVDFPVKK